MNVIPEETLNALADPIEYRLTQLNDYTLELIGKRIKEIGEISPSDQHLQQMKLYGADVASIEEQLAEITAQNSADIKRLFEVTAENNVDFAEKFYNAQGIPFIPYAQNRNLQKYVAAMAKQTLGEYVNMSQNTAFLTYNEFGDKVLTSLAETYQNVLDKAVTAVSTGTTDYQSTMRQTLRELADSGIRTKYNAKTGRAGLTADYATGYSRRLDTAVRQNVLWGVKECNQGISDQEGEEFGSDGWEVDYHSAPRPSHEFMGGVQFADGTEGKTVDGKYYPPFSPAAEERMQDYGCLHFKYPILLGISEPAYDADELADLKAKDHKTIEFEGKKYTPYEAKQAQRKLETAARHAKDRQKIAKAAGDDTLRREEQEKINLITQKYKEFSDAAGLPTKMERMSVSQYNRVKTKAELAAKKVDNSGNGGMPERSYNERQI